jgi:hypothetical protein
MRRVKFAQSALATVAIIGVVYAAQVVERTPQRIAGDAGRATAVEMFPIVPSAVIEARPIFLNHTGDGN